ncbi:MAG: DNA-directed RNA polymerase subunit beta [Clostridia bacterium]|nr:DNA-directed RNA polymerase subunit beta [Clostridia bacterium]
METTETKTLTDELSSAAHKHTYGKTERIKFGNINEVIDIPDLVAIQKESYNSFINEGIMDVFDDFNPICDYSDRYELYFLYFYFNDEPKYSIKECRDRDATYAKSMHVRVRLINKVTGQPMEQDVFMGDIPLMTDSGSFIINGAERVVVSQLVRSPGVYNASSRDKTGKEMFATTVIPSRGAWLEFEQDAQGVLWVHVDRKRKICATVLLRALGYGSDRVIRDLFPGDAMIENTIAKDSTKSESDGLVELYRRLRPGEIPTEASVKQHLNNLFYDPRRYDVVKVGRYKFNKKLNLAYRLPGCKIADDIADPDTGEIIIHSGEICTEEQALAMEDCGINAVDVLVSDSVKGEIRHRIIANHSVRWSSLSNKPHKMFGLLPRVYYPNFEFMRLIAAECGTMSEEDVADKYIKEINDLYYVEETPESADEKPEDRKNRERRKDTRIRFVQACKLFNELLGSDKTSLDDEERKTIKPIVEKLAYKHITRDDIVASISTNLDLQYGIGTIDNIDHLGNRRVRSVGELLTNQLRIGIARLEKLIKERMATQDATEVTPSGLVNVRPVSAVIREFFGSSQLSQFMDQTNPAAELTHKRKLSALGPGGLNRDRATFEVRDVHHSHYGRLCPIETPEGQNIGLISSLATFAKVNEYGFIMSPYRKVVKDENGVPTVTDHVDYLTADEEDRYTVAQANEPLDENNHFMNSHVGCRKMDLITQQPPEKIDYMDVSPKQLVSVATALIPFLENDDTNRALMGSNMQRQAVPLMKTESAVVATGIEAAIARDSGVLVNAKNAGEVVGASSDCIRIKEDISGLTTEYNLKKFERSNQGTCLNQRPIVHTGDHVEAGEIIADGPATSDGELALGKNILVGYMEWEGYNFEDAILISEKIVQDDVFTSIHIEEHETEARDTKLGPEEITRDIPNVSDDALKDLDKDGIIRIGAEVQPGDILVGKVTPKGETELTPEERLLRAIFGEKAREVRDTSLKVPHGEGGIVVDVKIFTRENKDELAPGVTKLVRVYIAQKRKVQVGDKMAGRHGNKGVISRVLPQADMPFLEDGTPLEIVLNPLGVPSRMNIGQVLEVHLGYICKLLGWKIATPVFDGARESDIKQLFLENGILSPEGKVDGKIQVYDGRTGEPFENRVTVGVQYMIKLIHLVDDKIHARSIGPYSLVTQQPLGGKAQFGGQRFGEMEVWALEAYGAAHILQEILTVKSDDVVGRVKTYESIVKGDNISEPGIPEAFKVLLKEMQSLALDVKVLTETGEELEIRELDDEDDAIPNAKSRDLDRIEMLRPDAEVSLPGLGEPDEEESDTFSLFDEDSEDYASDDLFSSDDGEDEDAVHILDDEDEDDATDPLFGDLFGDDDDDKDE